MINYYKETILSIQSLLLLFYMQYCTNIKKFLYFFIEYTIKNVRKISSTDHTS